MSLDKLIADGRIHPSRIEEIVARDAGRAGAASAEARRRGRPGGRRARLARAADPPARAAAVPHQLQPERAAALDRSGLPRRHDGREMGLDGKLARRCGLLHDIGKAADHEAEGGHPKIGADLLKRYGERPEVIHAALGHHDDLRIENPYTVLVATADACSASRPGARRETLERYIKRMEELESIAGGFRRRRAGLCHSGRPRAAGVGRRQRHDRRLGRQDLPRHRQGVRRTLDLSGRDQGHRAARVAVHRRSPSKRKDAAVRLLLIGDIVGKPGRQIIVRALTRADQTRAARSGRGQCRKRRRRLRLDARTIYRELLAAGVDCRHAGRPHLSPPRNLSGAGIG